MAAFLVQLIEFIAQRLFVGGRVPAEEGKGDDVVEMKGIWDGHEVSALQRHYERLVAARLLDVIEEAQALERVERFWRIGHPISVPPDQPLAGNIFNALHPINDKAALGIRIQDVAVLPKAS